MIKLVLILSLIGLTILFFISEYIKPPEVNPILTEQDELIKINGKILNIDEKEEVTYIKFLPDIPLTLVSFDKINMSFNLQNVVVTGKVDIYNNEKQIIVREIKTK